MLPAVRTTCERSANCRVKKEAEISGRRTIAAEECPLAPAQGPIASVVISPMIRLRCRHFNAKTSDGAEGYHFHAVLQIVLLVGISSLTHPLQFAAARMLARLPGPNGQAVGLAFQASIT
jgi:hypothetical protein